MRLPLPLSLAGLAVLLSFVLAGSAAAQRSVRPGHPVSVQALRALADHYRSLTWTFQRAAHVPRTATSFSYRRSSDGDYLRWTIDTWTRRAYSARDRALTRVEHRLSVRIPDPPGLRTKLSRRVSYSRAVALKLRRIYPGTVTRRFASAHGGSGGETLRLWQKRLAAATTQVLAHGYARPQIPAFLQDAFLCIHRYEGAWNANTGNGYYGGLQMDVGFQSRYGAEYLRRWGTADNWPTWAQLHAAVRAYRSGRGFYPWPNTARVCGLV
ncbi:MAG TPA: hypothetical protein VFK17_09220 [Gaiellaceae bacterium]|nr:hypothetical protein [Gaiellaceae bacterium]